jgi:DNA-binding PadR family transcriptional regulator
MRKNSSKPISQSPERIAILLALAHRSAAAPEISDQIISDSVGSVYLVKSTLYRLLHELEHKGYTVAQSQIYDLTPRGWRTLEIELGRVEQYRQLLQIRLSPRQYKAAIMPAQTAR